MTSVPLRFIGTFPVVMVTIEGNHLPLIFDLGDDSALALKQRSINRIKVIPSEETHRFLDVQGNSIESSAFIVPRLSIGNAVFAHVLGHRDKHDPTYQSPDLGDEGQFGTSLVRDYKVVLDYPHRKMKLIPQGSSDESCKGTVVPFLPDWNGEPVTRAVVDSEDRVAIWDTGVPVSILRRKGAQSIAADVLHEHVTAHHLVLGGTDFGRLKLDVADYAEPEGSDMFIGYTFFARHVVCIDFPGRQLFVQR